MAKNLFTLTVKTTTPANSELLVGGTGSANAYNFTWTKLKEWVANLGTNALIAGTGTFSGVITAISALFQKDQDAFTIVEVKNNTAGTGAASRLKVTSDTNRIELTALSSSYSTSGVYIQNATLIESISASQLGIAAFGSQPIILYTDSTERMSIAAAGTVDVVGTFTAGTKTFKIDHPLESMKDTHKLTHACVESPKADLIYRGKVQLVNGKAEINIDESATMTDGTFEALCRDIQCFTTNETGWDLIKGSISGNILTIQSKTVSSTDTISWMVIGERKDKSYIESELTDELGNMIVEPLKPIKEDIKDVK